MPPSASPQSPAADASPPRWLAFQKLLGRGAPRQPGQDWVSSPKSRSKSSHSKIRRPVWE